jgi:ribosomal protein S18 acetylase RimI-like enzyme
MSLRKFKIPQDAQTLIDIVPLAFQYPEHPEWSIDEAEKEELIESFGAIKKIWWLIRGVGYVWRPMQDSMLGYVWEEDGQAVGVCNVFRQSASQQWMIGNVAVLPEYRRRGIARKLVQACVDLAIERGAKQIVLDVIDNNVPAYELYKSIGFVHYAGQYIYEHPNDAPTDQPPSLPTEYSAHELKVKDWRLRYQLAQRITPNHVQEFEPVEEKKYRVPLIVRVIQPIAIRLLGMQVRRLTIEDTNHTVIGVASYHVRKNGKGNPDVSISLDKTHAQISQPLLKQLLAEIRQINSTGTIELVLPDWQFYEGEIDPSTVGFTKRLTHHRLGMQV